MQFSIEEALRRGVAAHKEGNLKDAESCYRSILKYQPEHADANHNLGLLALSVNKTEIALPLLKTALESNPKTEQFWLSYIEALVKANQLKYAQKLIEKSKKQGVYGEGLSLLEARLFPTSDTTEVTNRNVFQQKRRNLIEHYQNAQFEEAEKLAISITKEVPEHPLAWKVLGAIFKQQGKISESLFLTQKSVNLMPQDAEAHFNLGNTLKELGRLDEAVSSYNSAIEIKPDFTEAYYNLGNTFNELGKLNEAETNLKHVIRLNPNYAEAYNNLGFMLIDQGKLDEAETHLKKAIALNPSFADAHYNLGNALKKQGKLNEAQKSYSQAIILKPNFAEAYNNLGNTFKELGRLNETEASLKQAIALKPSFADAHNNLGYTLTELGRLDEAKVTLKQAIKLKHNNVDALHNLSIVQSYMNNLRAETVSLHNILKIDKDDFRLRAGVNLAICKFLDGDFKNCKKYLSESSRIKEKTSLTLKNEKIYWEYLSTILKWHENNDLVYKKEKKYRNLYVIGESHSLSSHLLRIQGSEIDFFCKAKLIKGCKQWHLGNAFRNKYKYQLESIFHDIPRSSNVLLAIGEIDCRLDTGIIVYKNKYHEKNIRDIIFNTIKNYISYIVNSNHDYQHKIIIQGVPCPNINVKNYSQKDVKQLVEVIKIFNNELKMQSKEIGFGFLDTHKLTDRGNGLSNNLWHIDYYHLSPDGMREAWKRYAHL